jgi:multiple sugar transport system substrate-binding protein
MKKKVLALFLSFVFLFSVGTASVNASQRSAEKVKLVYGIWDKNQEPVMQKLVDKFEAANPNIDVTIELTPYKQYWTKLETEATGGNLPDVFWMNGPNITKYANAGFLAPIDNNIRKDKIKLANFPKALIELYTINGKKYGIPKDWDTTAIWYNKKIFDDAKVAYPKATWTWDQMRQIAKKLTNKAKGIYGIAAAQDDQQGYYNTMLQAGGMIISSDKKISGYNLPGSIKGIQCWIDLIKDGSSPTAAEMVETQPQNLFESGKVAMVFQGSWMVPEFMNNEYLKNKVDIVSMPKIVKNAAVIHGLSNVTYSKTQHPKEAWELVKYLAGKEANEIVAKSGVVIPAYKPALQVFLNSYKKVNLKAYTNELDYAVMYPVSANTSKWVSIQDENLKKVWALEITAQQACKTISEGMNLALKLEKK